MYELPKYKIVTNLKLYDIGEENEEMLRERLVEEQDEYLTNRGYEIFQTDYLIHFFDSQWFNETITEMDIYTAIQCLAIKDGADLVKYENGHYGYVAYYNGGKNGFEILVSP